MRLGNTLTKIGALLCTSLLGIELAIVPASAQSSSDAFVVFVNGSGDCCAGAMWDVKQRFSGATIWTTSYASFRDGSTTNKVPVVNLSTDMDNAFIFEAAQVLNSVPESRPIILVGHSYGGDSVLKVLPFIKRRIQLVVTIDPVGTGGSRQIATSRRVPSNVDYFMNRWQENGLALDNIVPFDSRTNGSIPCSAGVCDQDSQNLARNADGSEIRVSCGAEEVSCDGWTLPGCNFGGCWKGSNGTKARRMFHNDMPVDDSIQRSVGNKIQERLAAFQPPVPAPPQNPNSSSFHLTCRNISINSNILSAECDRGGGSYIPTSIGLRGIWNRNGTLQEDPNTSSSSFQLSCRDLSIQGNVLSASCDNGNGAVIRSQLRLGGIWNDQGALRY
jgi:hypothetical protein